MKKVLLALLALVTLSASISAKATTCTSSSITDPVPFMGMSGDILTLTDGSMYKVGIGQYNYLYSYYPNVKVCDDGNLIVGSKTIPVSKVGNSTSSSAVPIVTTPAAPAPSPASTTTTGCDNTSVNKTFNAIFEGVKGGESVAMSYRLNFDSSTGTISGWVDNADGSYEMLSKTLLSSYSVNSDYCGIDITLNFEKSPSIKLTALLEQLNTTTSKPYWAYRASGVTTAYKTKGKFVMTRILK